VKSTLVLLVKRSQLVQASLVIGLIGIAPLGLAQAPSSQAPRLKAATEPLKIVFPTRGDSADLQRKADAVAAFLSKDLRMPVEAIVADETAAVEALRANRADVAFVNSRSALKAETLANAKLALAEVRATYSGGNTYSSIFVARKDNPLVKKGTRRDSLAQLQSKRMVFTSKTSGSGFIIPAAELVKQGFIKGTDRLESFFSQVAYGGNYAAALQAVLRKQADVAVVSEYTLGNPYITPEEASQLKVIAEIPGVPAHGITIDDDVAPALRNRIVMSMMRLNEPKNNGLFVALYNSTKLVRVDHDRHLAPMREALKLVGLEP
jgi:phosphonate transport system substrate-binding protein